MAVARRLIMFSLSPETPRYESRIYPIQLGRNFLDRSDDKMAITKDRQDGRLWRVAPAASQGRCFGERDEPCASGLAGKRAIDRSRDGGMGGIAEEAPVRAQEMFEVQLEEPSEFALE